MSTMLLYIDNQHLQLCLSKPLLGLVQNLKLTKEDSTAFQIAILRDRLCKTMEEATLTKINKY
jgi:hypothetical protein